MSSAGRVDLDLGLNYGLFQQQLNGIAGTANSLVGGAFKTLGGVIAGAFAVGGIVAFGKEAINLASDLAEVQNVVNVTFGSMTNQINNWSQNLINDFGLSELAGKKIRIHYGRHAQVIRCGRREHEADVCQSDRAGC